MPFLPTSVYGDGAEEEASYWPPLPASVGDKTDISEANILPMLLRAPKPKPVELFKMPSYTKVAITPWTFSLMKQGLQKFAKDKYNDAKETKNHIESEIKGLGRQIDYPENLINEAVNRHK